jgi:antitoxin component YwqK of YwqJK toxin-antitoxin module
MMKRLLFIIGISFYCTACPGQTVNNKMLFIIDSIPLLNDPEEWNPILQEDIADIRVVTDRDSLKLFGWEQVDGITFIFTKEYRNRSDSLKKIPSLKLMVMKDGVWKLGGNPYSGPYIDYYNNGRIQNQGVLLNGKLDGKLIVYFKNGNKKSVAAYKDGVLDGTWNEYYKNGALMQRREYINGKYKTGTIYFINGQVQHELKRKKDTRYDTALTYYSTGHVKKMKLSKNGVFTTSKKENDLNYYTTHFNQSINTGNIKDANRNFYQIWLLDSTGTDTYFNEGMLLAKEFRFAEAIAKFDKALATEPLMREALLHRGLARIKKHKYPQAKSLAGNTSEAPLVLEDLTSISADEQAKICSDLEQAEWLDFSEFYVMKWVPEPILNYCRKKSK